MKCAYLKISILTEMIAMRIPSDKFKNNKI